MYEVIIAGMNDHRGIVFASSDRQASETAFATEAHKHASSSIYLRKDGEVICFHEPGMNSKEHL